ncbi:MAG: hypothetical protein FJZ04_00415 [Candidatus Moranbacteria bacterium]|nr:hypothetical protein [Candidatus Moranbacteria bacterium]
MKLNLKSRLTKKVLMWESVMGPWTGVGNLPDPGGEGGGHPIAAVLTRVLNWLLVIFGLLALICFIAAGFLYLTARGDRGRIEKAHKAILYGVIGVVVGLIGMVAVKTIDSLLRGGGQ